MTELFREVQIPFLAVVLLAGAVGKALPHGRTPNLTRYRGGAFALGVGATEAVLGILLLTTSLFAVRLASVVFFATATSVVADLVRRGSDQACGCFGRLSTAPARRLGVVRAAVLTGAAVMAAEAPGTGVRILASADGRSAALLAVDCVVFLAVSPEVVDAIEHRLHPIPCELRDVPLDATYAALRPSAAWRDHAASLTSAEPTDVWRELCHRYLVYPGEVDGRAVEVVFAVPVDGGSAAVRAGVAWDSGWERQDDDSGPQRVHSPIGGR
ncbi:MauE/DoxX family redox-associated membrane protein [Actinoallomurus sp. NPDC052308]|uniref:MauE/DoxX family redox-associated membrane protein n=1 Tax=Actinoallomurus sp. NPDC052308 TaxID=3155530 RepID=UPI00342268A7